MTREDLIQEWLSRAQESLGEAEALLIARYHMGTVNRLYYACFYAVTALLLSEGHSSSKHKGVMSLFSLHWLKPKRLPVEMGKFYNMLYDRRLQGDYSLPAAYDRVEVEAWLAQARQFVQTVANLLSPHRDDAGSGS